MVGHAATLFGAAAAVGSPRTTRRKARRVDVVLAVVLLLSAAYCARRLLDLQVLKTRPGEGGLLP